LSEVAWAPLGSRSSPRYGVAHLLAAHEAARLVGLARRLSPVADAPGRKRH